MKDLYHFDCLAVNVCANKMRFTSYFWIYFAHFFSFYDFFFLWKRSNEFRAIFKFTKSFNFILIHFFIRLKIHEPQEKSIDPHFCSIVILLFATTLGAYTYIINTYAYCLKCLFFQRNIREFYFVKRWWLKLPDFLKLWCGILRKFIQFFFFSFIFLCVTLLYFQINFRLILLCILWIAKF